MSSPVDEATYRHPRVAARAVPPRRASVLLVGEQTVGAAMREHSPRVVGRTPPSDLVLPDRSLSRQHARLTWQADTLVVEDLGSTNGVFVDGERVERAEVGPESEVLLGSVRLHTHISRHFGDDAEDVGEGFARGLAAEVRRAETFRRPLAVLAVRSVGESDPGWTWQLRGCLRPVDTVTATGWDVALLSLAEAAREDIGAWVERLRAAMPGRQLRFGAATFPEHGDRGDALVTAALGALGRARGPEVVFATPDSRPVTNARAVVESPSMKALFDLVRRVARTLMPVLVLGETGVGKELVARAVHDASPRSGGPFKAINCATIPANLTESALFGHEKGAFTGATARAEGLFEQAQGGTVFLDEVGELPPQAQAALLRVLETKRITRVGGTREVEVDARVVAATHRDLTSMVNVGAFRSDLLYRLDAITLEVPPLRERLEDIRPLAEGFLAAVGEQWETQASEFEEAVLDAFAIHDWPGNVRQLKNVVERAAAISIGTRITLSDLPRAIASGAEDASPSGPEGASEPRSLTDRVAAFEREVLRQALIEANGNQSRAARILSVPRRTLAHKVKRHGLA